VGDLLGLRKTRKEKNLVAKYNGGGMFRCLKGEGGGDFKSIGVGLKMKI